MYTGDSVYDNAVDKTFIQSDNEHAKLTLICDKDTLIRRWKNDHNCEWRTDKWLEVSLASLPYFASMKDAVDTGELSVEQVADMIMAL